MGVESVQETWDGRGGSINSTYQRTYTRTFDVVTSGPYVGSKAVRAAAGIPQLGTAYTNGLAPSDPDYEVDAGAFVAEITAECLGGEEGAGVAWKVTCSYQPWDPSTFGVNPIDWPLRVTFGGERTERVVDFDVTTGDPIRNSAGDRFGDPVTVDDHFTTLLITRNELVSTFDIELASEMSDTINNAEWNGIPAGHAKMGIISTSEEQYDSNAQVWYYKVTYPVSVSRTFWRKTLLDQGYNELDDPNAPEPKARPIMNDGQPISDPVALDGNGQRLPVNGTPVALEFDVFDEADWSVLNIDLSTRLGL